MPCSRARWFTGTGEGSGTALPVCAPGTGGPAQSDSHRPVAARNLSLDTLPTLFITHGALTFAIEPGLAGPQLARIGQTLHRPDTLLDFGGFANELYEVQYPAPGHPELARAAATLLQGSRSPRSARRPARS